MAQHASAFRGADLDQIDPFDPEDTNLWRKAEYLGRYLFAADFLRQQPDIRIVADISCGLGYGAKELITASECVIGVDRSPELMDRASRLFVGPDTPDADRAGTSHLGVKFLIKDLDSDDLAPDIADGSVDAVVSFETIEHLIDPDRAVGQFSKVLRQGGFLICSVPNVLWESRDGAGLPKNKGHRQWFNFGSLCRMLEGHGMRVLYRLGQSWSKSLHKREQQLAHARRIDRKLSDHQVMHSPEMIRLLSYIAAYPTVEDVDGSYSIIVVARKDF